MFAFLECKQRSRLLNRRKNKKGFKKILKIKNNSSNNSESPSGVQRHLTVKATNEKENFVDHGGFHCVLHAGKRR